VSLQVVEGTCITEGFFYHSTSYAPTEKNRLVSGDSCVGRRDYRALFYMCAIYSIALNPFL
jgi:hypothetical protein